MTLGAVSKGFEECEMQLRQLGAMDEITLMKLLIMQNIHLEFLLSDAVADTSDSEAVLSAGYE